MVIMFSCAYMIVLGAFLPSVPGRARDADHRIKTPPVLSFSTYLFPIPEMGAPQDFILNFHEQMTHATSHKHKHKPQATSYTCPLRPLHPFKHSSPAIFWRYGADVLSVKC